jgi:hypothetical protein
MICVRQSSVGTIQMGIEGVISWKLGRWNVYACGLVGSYYTFVHTDIPGNDLQGED